MTGLVQLMDRTRGMVSVLRGLRWYIFPQHMLRAIAGHQCFV
jgi:hypothetical protein